MQASNAGAFLSLLDVSTAGLSDAIDKVFQSYGDLCAADEVLVQPMLTNVIRSGVGFSHDPTTSAPYRVLNWMDGEDTEHVTAGRGGRTWKQAAGSDVYNPTMQPVIDLIEEVHHIFCGKPVDVEFAVTMVGKEEQLWLLQARPLILQNTPVSETSLREKLKAIEEKIDRGMHPEPNLLGRKTVYGVMPDWNPAEIVGVKPKPLALSLYRELITDNIWAYQRHNYGYRNLRSFPLMPHFFGQPFVDVRLSFNSFIPADLDQQIASRLVDYYVDRLATDPQLHDKIEFDIVFSCYTLDLPDRLRMLDGAGFSKLDRELIENSLRSLTNRIINPNNGLWKADCQKLELLKSKRDTLFSSQSSPISRIYWLIEDAKRYGTLPFAGLARAGFVAVQMLKSLLDSRILDQSDYDAFIRSIETVSSQMARDRFALGRTKFLDKYGHLRPGSYEICSPRYDEAPDFYFDWSDSCERPDERPNFVIGLNQMRETAHLLQQHGLDLDPITLFDFMQSAIEQREFAKFEFTRNLSDVLRLIGELGEDLGISRDDLAYSDISIFKDLYVGTYDSRNAIMQSIETGKARYKDTQKITLPPLIAKTSDVWAFEVPETQPNFITQKQVCARPVSTNIAADVAGAIVCIPNADPGFDWLFSHPIAGFVTAWGGSNSHMAIRAGEMGIPAVIGAGEKLYSDWVASNMLSIDCAAKKVVVIA